MIVSENSCGHKNIERISGTKIREMIKDKIKLYKSSTWHYARTKEVKRWVS